MTAAVETESATGAVVRSASYVYDVVGQPSVAVSDRRRQHDREQVRAPTISTPLGTTTNTYDTAGNLTSTVDPTGRRIIYAYDGW
jgi:uncharacterized protein RhaS with RHS repeats